jgi:signal transduction histidine kinase
LTDWEQVYFLSHVNIKNIIGKELINDDNVAVMELVKNSYDAGALKVDVEFKNLMNSENINHEIIISDDGQGMSEDDILHKWLNLAYSIKRVQNTQNNRLQAGNKGIGRFSCDRLGKQLNIFTKQKNSKIYQLQIDWEDFENVTDYSVEINQIPMKLREVDDETVYKETKYKLKESGTIIQILNLRTKWIKFNENSLFNEVLNYQKFSKLKASLEKLINKSQVDSGGFKIVLHVKEIDDKNETSYYKKINGEIKNKFFNKLNFNTTYIQSAISDDGLQIITKLKDRDKIVFKTIEKNVEFPHLKGVKIILMYLNPYAKVYFEKQMGMRSVDFGSVFLFINGFRIPPYGDVGNDSFGMEVRKNQGRNRYLSNREVIGRIEIEDRDEQYQVISSREGIVQNEKFSQLIHKSTKSTIAQKKNNGFFYKTLRRLEKYVVEGIRWDSTPKGHTEVVLKGMMKEVNWSENKEEYVLTREEKQKNISKKLFNIMSIDTSNIMDLQIDNKILTSLKEKDSLQTQKNITKFLRDFSKVPHYAISKELKKNIKSLLKEIQDKNIIKKIDFILNNSLDKFDEIIDRDSSYSELDKKINVVETKNKQLEEELKESKKEKDQTEKQVNRLKKILSKDTKELVAFQHHIGLYANTAKDYVLDTIEEVKNNEFNKNDYLDNLQTVVLELEKIKIISKYITRENYLSAEKKVNEDLVQFIFYYTKSIYESTTNKEFNITINRNNIKYQCKFEPIKINIIIDNLLSNSKKEEINAKNIVINFFKEEDVLIMEYLDDGSGLDNSIVNIESIFDIAVSTTRGSGLGLYHIKELLNDMKSTISVERQPKGIKFLIRFGL